MRKVNLNPRPPSLRGKGGLCLPSLLRGEPALSRAKWVGGEVLLLALLAAILVVGGVALAQAGGPYNLEWHSFDGGGGQMAGGAYSLNGTIGQADAGAVMSGGSYSLSGGFWGGAASQSTIYSPLVLRNSAGS